MRTGGSNSARAIALAQTGNLLVAAVGATVLVGWLFGLPALTYLLSPGPNMKTNAGLAFLCAGVANQLLISARRGSGGRGVGRVLGAVTATLGGLTLSEHILGWDVGIDQLFASEASGAFATMSPNRMGPPASTAFLSLGLSMVLGDLKARRARRASEALALLACAIALLPIIGYAYGFQQLYSIARYTGIALTTAVALFVLGASVLAARPDRGMAAMLSRPDEVGTFVRRLLATALLFPFGLGWLLSRGLSQGIVDGAFAISSLVLVLMIGLCGVIFRTGTQLARALDARDMAEHALSESERSLREADRQKSEFLATLSHELRNPLAPIRFALELLQGPPETAARARQTISRQVSHLTRLIDDLLDLTRITRNKLQLQLRDVELRPLVQDAVDAVASAMHSARHQVDVQLPEEAIWLHADADRLVQVLTNLLGNALRYTPPGGHIVVGAERHGSEVLIYVRDNGVGLAPADLTRVFQMFVQVGEGSHGGLGIGLALVKGLIELHGGSIEALSEGPNRGAEFRIRLPRTTSPLVRTDASSPAMVGEPRRILVVDDNRDAADGLGEWLTELGNIVEVRYSAEEALDCSVQFDPDVALLDIGLPGMNGYELAARFRADERRMHMLLIAITGWGQEDDRRRALDAGFDAHLTKPADPSVILGLIAAHRPVTVRVV